MATLTIPHPLPTPAEDAENLNKSFKGWGTNEKTVISILAHRDASQRRKIIEAYDQRFNEDLIKKLESELKGDFEKAVYRWMPEAPEREAILVNVAAKKKIDFQVIVETVCLNSPEQLLAVKRAYQARYKLSLEEDVASNSAADLRQFLVPLVGTYRYDGGEINASLAQTEAKILHDALKDKAFHHEEVIRIIATRGKAQLNATFNKYKDVYGTSITKELPAVYPKQIVPALRVAIKCIVSPQKYLEKVMRNALSKSGTDEDGLTRVIVTRAEKDLKEIKNLYFKRNNVTLEQAVGKETSGDYKAFLLELIGGN